MFLLHVRLSQNINPCTKPHPECLMKELFCVGPQPVVFRSDQGWSQGQASPASRPRSAKSLLRLWFLITVVLLPQYFCDLPSEPPNHQNGNESSLQGVLKGRNYKMDFVGSQVIFQTQGVRGLEPSSAGGYSWQCSGSVCGAKDAARVSCMQGQA